MQQYFLFEFEESIGHLFAFTYHITSSKIVIIGLNGYIAFQVALNQCLASALIYFGPHVVYHCTVWERIQSYYNHRKPMKVPRDLHGKRWIFQNSKSTMQFCLLSQYYSFPKLLGCHVL
eukprot:1002347_1